MEAKAAGQTVAVDFQAVSGSPAIVSGYPVTNLYDGTTAAYRLFRECRFTIANTEEAAIRFDLGAARQVDYVAVVGLDDSAWDAWAASPAGALSSVVLESAPDGTTWTTRATVTAATSGGFGTLAGPALWLAGGASARWWRVRFVGSASATISLGYIHLGRDVGDLYGDSMGWSIIPSAVERVTERGNARVLPGVERRVLNIAGMLADSDRIDLFERLTRHAYRPQSGSGLVDPSVAPCLAIYPDEVGVSTTADRLATHRMPCLVTVAPSGWSVTGTRAVGWYPVASMTFAEWV